MQTLRQKQKAAAQKKYKQSEKGKLTQAKYYVSKSKQESSKRWRVNNKIKSDAHKAVDKAIKLGILIRENCLVCGKENAFAHHEDYSKQLEVTWLCNFHHTEHHRNKDALTNCG